MVLYNFSGHSGSIWCFQLLTRVLDVSLNSLSSVDEIDLSQFSCIVKMELFIRQLLLLFQLGILSHCFLRSGCLSSVTGAVNRLLEVGVHVPEWQEIADGLRPEDLGFAEWEPCEGRGWQRHASATVHEQYREQVVWPHLSLAESIGEVPKWAPCVSPVHSLANPQDLKNRSRTVQSVALETAPHASLPQCSRLPVWPSLRRPWPPSRNVQQGWGVGQKGVRCRKCCRSDLQGRRRASVHQRHVAGLGHFPSTQLGRTTFGSGGWRVMFVRRVPACFGCHSCLHAPRRWNTQEEGGRGGWSGAERGKKKQRGHTTCGHCWRGRRQVVSRDTGLLVVSGLREVQVFSKVVAGQRQSWMVQTTAKAVACSLVGYRGSPGSGDQVPSAHEVLTEARYLV